MSSDTSSTGGRESRGDFGEARRAGRGPLGILILLTAAILIVVVGIAGVEIGRSHNASGATISVGGTGTVKGTPDTASYSIGVHTTNASAKAAMEANNQKVNALIAALKRNGVTAKEMQTSGLNIYQNTNNYGVVTGFSVDNTLNVTMHNMKRVGSAIDAAATAVGNGIQLNGITFSISNQSKLLQTARDKAMKNARLAAGQLASAGSAHVTSLVRVTDQENYSPPVYYGFDSARPTSFKSSVPVQAGTQTVTVTVSVVYSLAS
jgi:uncharacterized protein YggE